MQSKELPEPAKFEDEPKNWVQSSSNNPSLLRPTSIRPVQSKVENLIAFFDMDDTLVQTQKLDDIIARQYDSLKEKHPHIFADFDDHTDNPEKLENNLEKLTDKVFNGEIIVPELFVEGGLELIVALKKSGIKVGIISHSVTGLKPQVEKALKEKGVKVDTFVTLKEVSEKAYGAYEKQGISLVGTIYQTIKDGNYSTTDQFRISTIHGKAANADMAIVAFKEMQITHTHLNAQNIPQYLNHNVVMIGDSYADLKFTKHIHSILKVNSCQAIHIRPNGIEFSDSEEKRLTKAKDEISAYSSENKNLAPVIEITNHSAIYSIIKDRFGITIPQPAKGLKREASNAPEEENWVKKARTEEKEQPSLSI